MVRLIKLKQFFNSIQGIIADSHANTISGIFRHCFWQIRKVFNLFPHEQMISESKIIARHKKCGVSALINSRGMYDYNNMSLIKLLVRKGGVFFDIGANIGSYTLIASEQNKAKVYAFEPHPVTFQLLKENIALNKRDNVHVFNFAAGSKNEKVLFTNEYGSSINRIVKDKSKEENIIEVVCIRIDSFCRQYNIRPEYVKIDVEGFENDVLIGFGEFLHSVDVLFIEMNNLSQIYYSKDTEDIIQMLRNNDLKGPLYFDFRNLIFREHKIVVGEDAIFISKGFYNKLSEIGLKIIH